MTSPRSRSPSRFGGPVRGFGELQQTWIADAKRMTGKLGRQMRGVDILGLRISGIVEHECAI